MKNKEIEELLNDIKKQLTIEERLGKEIAKDFHKTTLNYKEIKLLLSYIEQLENNIDEEFETEKDYHWCSLMINCKDKTIVMGVDNEEKFNEIITKKIHYCPMCGRKLGR